MKTKAYNKKADYSYTLGVYPTLELLQTAPQRVSRVFLSDRGRGTNSAFPEIEKICVEHNISVEYNDELLLRVAAKENTYALGVFDKFESKIDGGMNHVVLVNPSNMGNMGTIIRTMAGLGFNDLAIISPAADVFNPKVVAASMGAFFQVRFQYFQDFTEYREKHKRDMYAFVLNENAKVLTDTSFAQPYSLVFGNEGEGLSKDIVEHCESVFIKQTDDVDSLNLGISVGIALFWAGHK